MFAKIDEAYGKPVIFKNLNYGGSTYVTVIPTTCSKSHTFDFFAWAGAPLLLSVTANDLIAISIID